MTTIYDVPYQNASPDTGNAVYLPPWRRFDDLTLPEDTCPDGSSAVWELSEVRATFITSPSPYTSMNLEFWLSAGTTPKGDYNSPMLVPGTATYASTGVQNNGTWWASSGYSLDEYTWDWSANPVQLDPGTYWLHPWADYGSESRAAYWGYRPGETPIGEFGGGWNSSSPTSWQVIGNFAFSVDGEAVCPAAPTGSVGGSAIGRIDAGASEGDDERAIAQVDPARPGLSVALLVAALVALVGASTAARRRFGP